MNNALKVILALTLAVILSCGGFVGGFFVGRFSPSSESAITMPAEKTELAKQVEEVQRILAKGALNPPSETSATAGTVQGLLESGGDKYGLYFDAKHLGYFEESNAGEFGGIGVTLGEKDGSAYVVEVFKDTPAEKAGMKAGDIFSKIDDQAREKWTTEEVVKRVRGKEGTTVTVVMLRVPKEGGEPAEKTFTMVRDTIEFPNVDSELYDKVGYIRVAQFNAKAADDIKTEITALEKKGATSLVLDLRDNPGGLLNEAVDVSSLFIDGGVVVRVEARTEEPVEYRTTNKRFTTLPLVVLINENSASASEIVGGALQDYGRAKLVGDKSFGKGSVQEIEELSFGGAVKYTTAHYLTPKKRVIDGKGLTPDVTVKMDIEKQADPKTDTQLQKALELAKKAK